jgi:regulator of sirC expression with transglutaminase-like and TPR domain
MQSEMTDQFQTLAGLPESQLGLAEGALIVAAESRPEIDIESSLAAIAQLVERIRPHVDAAETPSRMIGALNHAFFEVEGFRGNRENYDDPRNSDLEHVLSRRKGLPITLSVLYVEIARQLGLEAYGVGFPAHFLAKIVGVNDSPEGEIIVDAFFGQIVGRDECGDRLRAALGEEMIDDRRWLRPVTALEIYVRMLNNLKILYLRDGDGLGALGCFDRILTLSPMAAHEYRDRGFLLERLQCTHAAIANYTQFLELAPDQEDSAAIRRRRDALSQAKPTLN